MCRRPPVRGPGHGLVGGHVRRGPQRLAVHVHRDDVPEHGGSTRYPDELRSAYRVNELVGPADPATWPGLHDRSVRLGIVELPAGFAYPPHRHEAAELYVVQRGQLAWEVDGDRFEVRPGSVVRHEPWAVHAMEVLGDEPAELLYVWYLPVDDPAGVLTADAELVEPQT